MPHNTSNQAVDQLALLFCKPPIPGSVKTRLIPALGLERATGLYREMLRRSVGTLHHSDWDAAVHVAGGELQLDDDPPYPVFKQQGATLGQRMAVSLESGLSGYQRVVLFGADCPTINSQYLADAFDALLTHDVVLGPAEDGGYGLVGVREKVPDMFTGIAWSTDQVLTQTCARLNELRLNYALLPPIWDVDEPEDLPRYEAWLEQQQGKDIRQKE